MLWAIPSHSLTGPFESWGTVWPLLNQLCTCSASRMLRSNTSWLVGRRSASRGMEFDQTVRMFILGTGVLSFVSCHNGISIFNFNNCDTVLTSSLFTMFDLRLDLS